MASTTIFGFLLLQTAAAGSGIIPIELRNPEGVITNPSYPKDDPGQDVVWVIGAINASFAEWRRVQFVVDYVNIIDYSSCELSYLRIRDDAVDGTILATFCGEHAMRNMPPVESSARVMYVIFHTNSSSANQGARFQARYKVVPSTTMDVDLKTTYEATVSTPNYPDKYPSNAYREWNVEASATYEFGISLDFRNFDVPSRGDCEEDYVEILQGNSFLELSSMGKYCNNLGEPGSIFSLKSKVRIVLSSVKHSSPGNGFKVQLKRKSLLVRIMIPVLCCVLLIAGVIVMLCFIRRRNARRRRMVRRSSASSMTEEVLVQNDELETNENNVIAQVDSDGRLRVQFQKA